MFPYYIFIIVVVLILFGGFLSSHTQSQPSESESAPVMTSINEDDVLPLYVPPPEPILTHNPDEISFEANNSTQELIQDPPSYTDVVKMTTEAPPRSVRDSGYSGLPLETTIDIPAATYHPDNAHENLSARIGSQ